MNETLTGLTVIFGISQEELTPIFDNWTANKRIELNNRITDIRTQLYIKTGFELKLTTNDLNMILEEDNHLNFKPYLPIE